MKNRFDVKNMRKLDYYENVNRSKSKTNYYYKPGIFVLEINIHVNCEV